MPLIPVTFILLLLIGILVNVAAMQIGIADVHWHMPPTDAAAAAIDKQIGFSFAPNWGLTALFFLPAAIAIMMLGVESFKDAMDDMIERGMLRRTDGNMTPLDSKSGELKKLKKSLYISAIIIGALIFICVLVVMVLDFNLVSATFSIAIVWIARN